MPSNKIIGPSIAERIEHVRARMREACVRANRPADAARLLAVAKLHSPNAIREAYSAGQREFAENYAQEAVDKIAKLGDLADDLRWHFIGQLQSNKARLLARKFSAIHSVDRFKIAQALANDPAPQDIYLQFNVASEDSKAGVQSFTDLQNLFSDIDTGCPSLRVRGLMTMPPLDKPARPFFSATRAALEQLRETVGPGSRHSLDQLSMGTSADFSEAIQEGATVIRVGSEIFGPRLKENS